MKKQSSLKESGLVEAMLLCRKSLFGLMILVLGSLTLMQSCKKADFTPNRANSTNSENAVISGSYDLKLIGDNFVSPLGVVDPKDGTKRLFVIDQIGKVWIINPDGTTLANPFLDISSKLVTLNPDYDERGLLSLAFHPNFKSNGKFYVFYTAPPRPGGPEPGVRWDNLTRISEFKVSAGNPNKADMSSERVIFEANHPQSNHNGGTIAFGPDDGYLYISIGDGGNYGWNVKEGTHCFNTDNDLKERFACPVEDSAGNPLLDPVIEAKNSANPEGGGETIAIVGGNVYRGTDLPLLYGEYVFGFLSASFDGPQGKIVVAKPSSIGLWPYEVLKLKSFPDNLGQWLKGFGQNARGDIYVTASKQLGPTGFTGKVWKLVAAQ